jgi:hypothetical protein
MKIIEDDSIFEDQIKEQAVDLIKLLAYENEYIKLAFSPYDKGVCDIYKGYFEPEYDVNGNKIPNQEPHINAGEYSGHTFEDMTEEDEEYIISEAEKIENVNFFLQGE